MRSLVRPTPCSRALERTRRACEVRLDPDAIVWVQRGDLEAVLAHYESTAALSPALGEALADALGDIDRLSEQLAAAQIIIARQRRAIETLTRRITVVRRWLAGLRAVLEPS